MTNVVECLSVTDVATCQVRSMAIIHTLLDYANSSADMHPWVLHINGKAQADYSAVQQEAHAHPLTHVCAICMVITTARNVHT